MNTRPRIPLFFFIGILFLTLAGTRHAGLVEARREYHLQEVAPEDTTPLVAITTVAFGGFRGLVADALWVRANELQENGQFFELVQLASWITQLEPRVPEVWSFQAWNLAYNISVLFPEPEDRWRWVTHGLDLLRKEGLTHNPSSAALHWDIGWMFQHKIGMDFDQAHLTYKRRLAESVEKLFGGPFPDYDHLSASQLQSLHDTFRMDPAFMRGLDKQYGPLDWRLPASHSLYWAARGETLVRQDAFRLRMLQRMRMQSLADLLRRGQVLGDPSTPQTITLPRLELLAPVVNEYEAALLAQPTNAVLRNGYTSFLDDAVYLHMEYADLETAGRLYQSLAQLNREVDPSQAAFMQLVEKHFARHPGELPREQALIRVVAQLRLAKARESSDPAQAAGLRQVALQTHRLFQESRQEEEHLARTGLPPFEVIETLLRDIP